MEFTSVTQAAAYTVGTGGVAAFIGSIGITVIETGGLAGMSATTMAVATLASTTFVTVGGMFMLAGCVGFFFTASNQDVEKYATIVSGVLFSIVLIGLVADGVQFGVADLERWV